MSRNRALAAGVAGVVLLGVGYFAATGGGADGSGSNADSSHSNKAGGTNSGNGSSKSGSTKSKTPSESLEGGTTKSGSAKSEVHVQPEGQKSKGLPGISGKAAKVKPLVNAPLPKTASARGAVVTGYPSTVLPIAPESHVVTSSVSSQSTALQVALQATNTRSAAKVLKYYRISLAKVGFSESSVPAVGGSTASSFQRGEDAIVVTVTPRSKKRSSFSVFGTLHASKHG